MRRLVAGMNDLLDAENHLDPADAGQNSAKTRTGETRWTVGVTSPENILTVLELFN